MVLIGQTLRPLYFLWEENILSVFIKQFCLLSKWLNLQLLEEPTKSLSTGLPKSLEAKGPLLYSGYVFREITLRSTVQ